MPPATERRRALLLHAAAKSLDASREFLRAARGEVDEVGEGLANLFEALACLSEAERVIDPEADPKASLQRMHARIRAAVERCDLPKPSGLI